MPQARIISVLGLAAALLAVPLNADAQNRGRVATGRAVPRHGPPPGAAPVHRGGYRPAYPHGRYYRPYYYTPYYYGGYPAFYGPYAAGYGFGYPTWGFSIGFGFGYGYPAYGYPAYGYPAYGYPAYPYPAYGYPYRPYGGVRIDVPQRDAEVYLDGYFAGAVDNYDGTFQQLNLEPGPHKLEIRAPGFSTVAFDVNVEPGRTITYRTSLRPTQR
jgi:hypothetical protein